MRFLIVSAFVTVHLACTATFAKPMPLGVKDVSLMLRSGYSAAQVQQELASRYFVGPIDAAAETTLLKSGAPPELIGAMKSGAFAVPASELAATEQELAEQAKRKALQAEEAQKFNTLYQNQVAEKRAAAAKMGATDHALMPLLKGDLVGSGNGTLAQFEDAGLAKKKLIGLYFSAFWCGPCRKFTPQLVQFYNRVAPAHPEFEIVFLSFDKSAPAMENYMREMHMPWPAVKFDKLAEKEALRKYAGSGIPCLVVVDAEGRVVSDSFVGGQYVGPGKVLGDLDRMWEAPPGPIAFQR